MAFSRWTIVASWTIFAKHSMLDVDRVLNMPLDYSSCFIVVLRGIHRNIDVCETD